MKFFTTVLFLSAVIFASAQPVQPQFPNDCTGEGFAVLNPQDNGTNSNLYSISPAGAYTLVGATNVPSLNAIGMDGRLGKRYIWGMNSATPAGTSVSANLYRMGSDGAAAAWATIAPPTGSGLGRAVLAYAGDMNPLTGNYYVPAVVINSYNPFASPKTGYTFYLGTFNTDAVAFNGVVTPTYTAVNLGNCSGAVSTFMDAYAAYVLAGSPPGSEPSGLFQDLALNPAGNTIYGFMGIENVLLSISVPGGTANCINADASNVSNGYVGCTGPTTCEIGGMFFSPTGTLYAVQVDRAITYTVNTTTGQLTVASSGQFPLDSRGDAARCATISIIPTPITLTSFTATPANCDVIVKWTTAQEINNDRFEIESSQNGISFQNIATIKSKGGNATVQQEYSAMVSLLPGTSFLRLKQIDVDSKATYSHIVTATSNCSVAWNKNIQVYPRLLQTNLINIKFYSDKSNKINVAVYRVDGKLIQQQYYITAAGTTTAEMIIGNLSKGLYLLKINSEDGLNFSTKITRQ